MLYENEDNESTKLIPTWKPIKTIFKLEEITRNLLK
jgi:hypothetical protein